MIIISLYVKTIATVDVYIWKQPELWENNAKVDLTLSIFIAGVDCYCEILKTSFGVLFFWSIRHVFCWPVLHWISVWLLAGQWCLDPHWAYQNFLHYSHFLIIPEWSFSCSVLTKVVLTQFTPPKESNPTATSNPPMSCIDRVWEMF